MLADCEILLRRSELRNHAQWCVMSQSAVNAFIDNESDERIVRCETAHKRMMKNFDTSCTRTGYMSPAPDEWVPLTLLLLHSRALSSNVIISEGMTDQFIEECANHPVEWTRMHKTHTIKLSGKKKAKWIEETLATDVQRCIEDQTVAFYRKVMPSVGMPDDYIEQLHNEKLIVPSEDETDQDDELSDAMECEKDSEVEDSKAAMIGKKKSTKRKASSKKKKNKKSTTKVTVIGEDSGLIVVEDNDDQDVKLVKKEINQLLPSSISEHNITRERLLLPLSKTLSSASLSLKEQSAAFSSNFSSSTFTPTRKALAKMQKTLDITVKRRALEHIVLLMSSLIPPDEVAKALNSTSLSRIASEIIEQRLEDEAKEQDSRPKKRAHR